MAGSIVGQLAGKWQERFERFRSSPRTIGEFCLIEGVSVSSFYYWRKKLELPPLSDQRPSNGRSDFAPVRLVTSVSANMIVQLPGGTRFEIPTSNPEAFERAINMFVAADSQRTEASSC